MDLLKAYKFFVVKVSTRFVRLRKSGRQAPQCFVSENEKRAESKRLSALIIVGRCMRIEHVGLRHTVCETRDVHRILKLASKGSLNFFVPVENRNFFSRRAISEQHLFERAILEQLAYTLESRAQLHGR